MISWIEGKTSKKISPNFRLVLSKNKSFGNFENPFVTIFFKRYVLSFFPKRNLNQFTRDIFQFTG